MRAALTLLAAFPNLALAAAPRSLAELADFAIALTQNAILPVVFIIAFVLMVYGILNYFFFKGPSPEARQEGLKLILYGIGAFVFMVTFFGLVSLFLRVIQNDTVPVAPPPVVTPP